MRHRNITGTRETRESNALETHRHYRNLRGQKIQASSEHQTLQEPEKPKKVVFLRHTDTTGTSETGEYRLPQTTKHYRYQRNQKRRARDFERIDAECEQLEPADEPRKTAHGPNAEIVRVV